MPTTYTIQIAEVSPGICLATIKCAGLDVTEVSHAVQVLRGINLDAYAEMDTGLGAMVIRVDISYSAVVPLPPSFESNMSQYMQQVKRICDQYVTETEDIIVRETAANSAVMQAFSEVFGAA